MEVQELRPGLWRWTAPHPQWEHAEHWGPEVGSVYAELPDALVVIDPIVPADEDELFWSALDRDVERVARRYHATLWRPEERGELPGGVRAEVVHGSDWVEALFYLEPHRALVAGDLLIGADGGIELPVPWFPKAEQEWAVSTLRPELRARLSELPIELVVVSHGEPVLTEGRAALDRALS